MNDITFVTSIRGHLIWLNHDTNKWFYEDGEEYSFNDRPCTKCDIVVDHDQPDPCLGRLDGVDYACCGHGNSQYEYVSAGGVRYNSLEEWRQAQTVLQ